MGTSTFAEYTVMPEIALAKVDPEAPLDGACLFACGLSTGLGAAMKTARRGAGLDVRRVRRRHGRSRRGRRLPAAGRRADRLRRPLRRSGSSWRAARARPNCCTAARTPSQTILDDDRRLRRRLHLRGDRQRGGDAPGGRGGAHGLGAVHGLPASPGKGETLDVVPRFLITGPARLRLLLRRAEGTRRRARARCGATSPARSTSTPFISHRITLDDVNRGFELMEAQDGIRSVIEF